VLPFPQPSLAGIDANPAFFIGDAGQAKSPITDGIAPNDRLSRLVLEARQNVPVAFVVDMPRERLPLPSEIAGLIRTVKMRIVDVLDHRLSRMQPIAVGYVVEKQQQLVRTPRQRCIQLLHLRRILPDISRAGLHRAIHTDSLVIGAVPLSPHSPRKTPARDHSDFPECW